MAPRKPVPSVKPRSASKARATLTPIQVAQRLSIERDLAFNDPFQSVEGRLATMERRARAIVAMDAATIEAARTRALKESRKRGDLDTYDPTLGARRAAHEVIECIPRVRTAIGAGNAEEAVWHTLLLGDLWARVVIEPVVCDMQTGHRRRSNLKAFSQRGNTIKRAATATVRDAIKVAAKAMQEGRGTKLSKLELASRIKKIRNLSQSVSTIRRWL